MSSSAPSRATPTRGATGKKRTETRRNKGAGYVYVITNPAWPGYCKVGRTTGLAERLRTYQTASPLRDFRLHYHRWFADACLAERTLRRTFSAASGGAKGEWYRIHPDDAASLIDKTHKRLRRGGLEREPEGDLRDRPRPRL
ncbi:GIY-YIG nuclease family protein [Mesorhizobium sp. M7A.T.Ca.US.000.02.1.1]|nr:GIY-YIG nuclease family protein [Mesorhizobium sp. M7A.T.Ca.US.000.02.2.1]RUT87631.1 GIY-YIG nuclease family protein [Mesorhizobium sp. M7A.T.Ca.US.000.02.1.1]